MNVALLLDTFYPSARKTETKPFYLVQIACVMGEKNGKKKKTSLSILPCTYLGKKPLIIYGFSGLLYKGWFFNAESKNI